MSHIPTRKTLRLVKSTPWLADDKPKMESYQTKREIIFLTKFWLSMHLHKSVGKEFCIPFNVNNPHVTQQREDEHELLPIWCLFWHLFGRVNSSSVAQLVAKWQLAHWERECGQTWNWFYMITMLMAWCKGARMMVVNGRDDVCKWWWNRGLSKTYKCQTCCKFNMNNACMKCMIKYCRYLKKDLLLKLVENAGFEKKFTQKTI